MTSLDASLEDEARTEIAKVREWLGRLSYKPGSQTTVEPRSHVSRYPVLSFEFIHRVLDSHDPSMEIEVRSTELLPVGSPILSDFDTFTGWWRMCWHRMERHETDEWILVDGERRFDPHKDQG